MSQQLYLYSRLLFFVIIGFSSCILAQGSSPLKFSVKVIGEHRDNISRVPDSTKLSDYRMQYSFVAEYRDRIYENIRLAISYDGRYYQYTTQDRFNRLDHRLRLSFSKPLYKRLRIGIEEDFRLRLHPSLSSINHQRNIFDVFIKFPFFSKSQMSLGVQYWTKRYPKNNILQRFQSNRIYTRISRQIMQRTNLGFKYTIQSHRGNLFPGSTAPDQLLSEESIRHVFNFTVDRIINRRLLLGLTYRYELDEPLEPDFDEFGRRLSDEEAEELLADDADFGYAKHQLSLSSVIRFNSKISFITFYLLQFKKFDEWKIFDEGPKRDDNLLFLSNLLRIKLNKNIGLQMRYNLEENDTNLAFYKYRLNSISAGFFWQR